MTQTTDFANAEAPELNCWLAEQPCPESSCIDGLLEQMCDCGDGPDLHTKKHEACNGLGLAFPWASEKCPCITYQGRTDGINHAIDEPPFGFDMCKPCYLYGHQDDCRCVSGRVPKAVGLEELLEITGGVKPNLTWMFNWFNEWECTYTFHLENGVTVVKTTYGETPLLAALRSVCMSLQP